MSALGGMISLPLIARAQNASGGSVRIGVLWHAGSADEEREYLAVLVNAFRDHGYVEGKNIEFLHRFPAEQPDKFRAFAEDLIQSRVDLVIAVTAKGTIELKKASSTIPIVFVVVPDPVGFRLVESLAHPGGNATGLSLMAIDVASKRLGLLREVVPSLSRVALLVDAKDPSVPGIVTGVINAAKQTGIEVRLIEVASREDIEPAFAAMERDRIGAANIVGSLLFTARAQVGASAVAHKMPTIAIIGEMVPYGVLLSYGPDFPDYFRRAAAYADKILRGAKPADLPVEQPTRFKQVVNLKAAKSLGLAIPSSLLVGADEVVE